MNHQTIGERGKAAASDAAGQQNNVEAAGQTTSALADTTKTFTSTFGKLVSLFMRSPQHKERSLEDLSWLALPAIMSGQFTLAEGRVKSNGMMVPVAVITWARVSAEVDARLQAEGPAALRPEDWSSGDICWLMDAIGEPQIVKDMLKKLMAKDEAVNGIKVRTRDKDGKPAVGFLTTKSKSELQ